jgi:4-amino-4-deoxy-L-arabinose transferase-like glycosyltransferase
LRFPLLFFPEVIHNDGIEYIRHAKRVLSGDWSGGKAPPLYPALVAFAHLFIPEAERAGILISIIFGSLLILPVFYLGKEMFNTRVGILSALFAAVHPVLNISSGSVLTESTYHFLFATSVLLGWNAFNRGGFYSILSFSLFTALAYLNRPEAIGLLLIFSAWTLFMNPLGGERRFVKKIVIILVALATFFAFSFPYLMEIRRDTGTWRISKKAVLSVGSLSREEEAPSFGN